MANQGADIKVEKLPETVDELLDLGGSDSDEDVPARFVGGGPLPIAVAASPSAPPANAAAAPAPAAAAPAAEEGEDNNAASTTAQDEDGDGDNDDGDSNAGSVAENNAGETPFFVVTKDNIKAKLKEKAEEYGFSDNFDASVNDPRDDYLFKFQIILVDKEGSVSEIANLDDFEKETGLTNANIIAINGAAANAIIRAMKNKKFNNETLNKFIFMTKPDYSNEDILPIQITFFDFVNQMLFMAAVAGDSVPKFASPIKEKYAALLEFSKNPAKIGATKIFNVVRKYYENAEDGNNWWNSTTHILKATSTAPTLSEFTEIFSAGPEAMHELFKIELKLVNTTPFSVTNVVGPQEGNDSISVADLLDADADAASAELRDKAAKLYEKYKSDKPATVVRPITMQELFARIGVAKAKSETESEHEGEEGKGEKKNVKAPAPALAPAPAAASAARRTGDPDSKEGDEDDSNISSVTATAPKAPAAAAAAAAAAQAPAVKPQVQKVATASTALPSSNPRPLDLLVSSGLNQANSRTAVAGEVNEDEGEEHAAVSAPELGSGAGQPAPAAAAAAAAPQSAGGQQRMTLKPRVDNNSRKARRSEPTVITIDTENV